MLEKNVRKIVSKTNNYPFKCFLTRFEITFFPRTVMQKVRLGLHMERVRLRFVVVTVKREIFFFIFQNSRDLDKTFILPDQQTRKFDLKTCQSFEEHFHSSLPNLSGFCNHNFHSSLPSL